MCRSAKLPRAENSVQASIYFILIQPATSVNALVAPWLQFMIRDWFSHGRGDASNMWTIRLDGDPWPVKPMQIPRTPADRTRPPNGDGFRHVHQHRVALVGTHRSSTAPRWRCSGSCARARTASCGSARTGCCRSRRRRSSTRRRCQGFWLGIALLQIIFIREHNSICDGLRSAYPSWSDDDLFERARLINAALIAKIHTGGVDPGGDQPPDDEGRHGRELVGPRG